MTNQTPESVIRAPMTEEVRDNYTWGASACGCCAEYRDEDYEKFDLWRVAHDAEVAAKAWDEGYWQGINGHTGPGNPYRDSGVAEYRKAVGS